MRKNEIMVPHGAQTKIANDTGLSTVCVRQALKGLTDTVNTRLIRRRALKFYGGVEIKSDPS
ncbi:MAG: hypothetical protein E6547_10995 [Parabacteroides sp.]|nr:hypothetical protein [Parabacteroides sp.]